MSLDNKAVNLADLKVSHDYLVGQDSLLSERIDTLGSGIDDVESFIGDLSDLSTTLKDNLVDAINEVLQTGGKVKSVNGKTGDVVLKTSDLTNDSGYLTSYTETDPTVPSWAKQQQKPSYTASEVGAATTEALTTEITTRTASDAQLQSQITALGNGAPIPVETVAEMIDNTKAYLYTGAEVGWLTGYWYTYDSTQAKFVPRGEYGVGTVIDDTLTVPGGAADAKATGDALTTVNGRLDEQAQNVGGVFGKWTVGHVTSNGFTADTRYAYSGVIKVSEGDLLKVSANGYYYNVFTLNKTGNTGVITSDYTYDSTIVSGYLDAPTEMTMEEDTYLIVDCRNGSSYSGSTNIDVTQIPIDGKVYSGLVLDALNAPVPDGSVTKYKTTFWEHEKSANLFNSADTENIVRGKYINTNSGGLNDNTTYFVAYTRLEGAGDYTLIVNTGLYGISNAKAIHFYDENKTYLSQIDGVYLDTSVADRPLKVTVPQSVIDNGAVYIGWTGKIAQINEVMIVKASTYPSEYESYVDQWTIPGLPYEGNPLFGKSVSFNGDSICYGAGYTGGYGAIISTENGMKYQNIGIAGGTVTSGTTYENSSNRYWINEHITDMDENADYAIVEGGVNDSSLQVTLGAITEDYNAALDNTTFYGAMESICKQIVERFNGKKYGFIIVHQMSRGLRPGGAYHTAVMECCSKWGIPVLDLSKEIPAFGFFTNGTPTLYALREAYTKNGDGWHPNEAGYRKYYVDKITAWMKTL